MKKTLITLIALSGLAMAEDSVSKDITYFTDPTLGDAAGSYNGIVFTLSDNARLNVSETVTPTSDTFKLTSVQVLVRSGNTWGNNDFLYIVDSNKKLIAASNIVTGDTTGGNYITFEFGDTTNILASGKNNVNQALTLGETYYAYFGNMSQKNNWYITVHGEVGATVNYLNAQQRQITCAGPTDAGTKLDATMAAYNEATPSTTSDAYAPVLKINGTVTVPEPATATLSLLALAGLAARRRRH